MTVKWLLRYANGIGGGATWKKVCAAATHATDTQGWFFPKDEDLLEVDPQYQADTMSELQTCCVPKGFVSGFGSVCLLTKITLHFFILMEQYEVPT